MKRSKNRVLSFVLAALMAVGIFAISPAPTANAAMPTPGAGDASDGVDMTALSAQGNGIYYGTYAHARSLSSGTSGTVTSKEGAPTPILWRVLGEEKDTLNAGDGCITVMSEYVLDSQSFDLSTINLYGNASIRGFLNDSGQFPSNFIATELDGVHTADIYSGVDTTSISIATNQQFYLPWGNYTDRLVGWGADDRVKDKNLTNNTIGALKSGTAVYWWLRTPYDYSNAGLVLPAGDLSDSVLYNAMGVRPAFKLIPSTVIFASEIGGSGAGATAVLADNYAAGTGGAKNYKLTVLNSSLTAGTLTAGSDAVTNTLTKTVTSGDTIAVAAAGASAGTKLTYKIVGESGGVRTVVGYGQSADNQTLSVSAKDLYGANLPGGNYTVYVWAQKNNALNSHEGSLPVYFTLTVQAPPVITSANSYTCMAGTGGSFQVTATGTPSTFTYSLTGQPTGVSINDSTGLITVASTVAAGTYSFTVDVTNGINPPASQNFTLTVSALPPMPGAGDASDGVDIAALSAQGNGIYYGTYDHATSLANGEYGTAAKSGTAAPILWRVLGEETTGGIGDCYITVMSEYVLDSMQFDASSNIYASSEIQNFLSGTFMNSFTAAEKNVNTMPRVNVVTNNYTYGDASYTIASPDYSSTVSNQQAYLLWGAVEAASYPTFAESLYWSANGTYDSLDNLNNSIYMGQSSPSSGKAYLKGDPTQVIRWWLRSPYSGGATYALDVNFSGGVDDNYVYGPLGVRPAFKLNPSSVIFASEIGGSGAGATVADANYAAAAGGGAKNYKLTVVGGNSGADVGTLTGVPTAAQYTTAASLSLTGLAAAPAGADYTINYKIVAAGTPRTIVGYGFTAATNTNLTIDTSSLMQNESYDVYVWLQKNNALNSHEGTYPTHFTLAMSAPPAPPAPPSGGGGGGDGYIPPKIQKPPVTTPTPFPAQGTAQKRLSAYVLDTLKGKVAFRVNKGDGFTLLGVAENGKALLIQKGELKGYIAIKDFKAAFGAQLKATATAKKAGVYTMQANGKLKRIGHYPLGTLIGVNGMDGGYFISKQPGGTYWLKVGEWRISTINN